MGQAGASRPQPSPCLRGGPARSSSADRSRPAWLSSGAWHVGRCATAQSTPDTPDRRSESPRCDAAHVRQSTGRAWTRTCSPFCANPSDSKRAMTRRSGPRSRGISSSPRPAGGPDRDDDRSRRRRPPHRRRASRRAALLGLAPRRPDVSHPARRAGDARPADADRRGRSHPGAAGRRAQPLATDVERHRLPDPDLFLLAPPLALLVYRMLKYNMPYHHTSAAEYDTRQRTRILRGLRKRATSLGFELVEASTGLVV